MRTFADGSKEPSDQDLQKQLGDAWPQMQAVLSLTRVFLRQWTFSNTSGWMLKIHDGTKALLYVIPLHGSFEISLALRAKEHEVLVANKAMGEVAHEQLAGARKNAEGWALKFDVSAAEDLPPIEPFLRELIRIRREGTL